MRSGLKRAGVLLGATVAAAAGGLTVVRGTGVEEEPRAGPEVQNVNCDTTAMQIQFTRSGGFTGVTLTASVDTDSLPEEDRQRVCRLVEDANFFDLPGRLADSTPEPDGFSYEITIDDGSRKRTVNTTDGAAPDTLIPLLDWLNRAARRSQRG